MPTFKATVGDDRNLTLPAALCKRLKIKPGTPVEFFLTTDGQVHFHAITGTAKSFGGIVMDKRSPQVSIREIDDGIGDHLAEKHERLMRQSRRRTQSAAE